MNIEFFYAPGCSRCAEARAELRAAAESLPDVHWHEVDISKDAMRAVTARVVTTPAVAIDGQLAFRTSPAASPLEDATASRQAR